jgi:hypothetical protein
MNPLITRTLVLMEARGTPLDGMTTFDRACVPASELQRRTRAGPGASLRRPALRADVYGPACRPGLLVRRARVRRDSCPSTLAPAMLGLVARRRTRCVRCAHFARTTATSQLLKRAARAATSPALLGASKARPILPGPAFAGTVLVFGSSRLVVASRQAVSGRGDFWGGEKRSPAVGARSALRGLTRRGWSNAATAGRVVSSAARPQGEHRSGVGAKRRPPQHEPLAGAACRDAHLPGVRRGPRIAATDQTVPLVGAFQFTRCPTAFGVRWSN